MLLAGPAGLLVDRGDPRRIVIAAAAGRPWSPWRSRSPTRPPAILGLAALLGCGIAVAKPAEFALVPAVAATAG